MNWNLNTEFHVRTGSALRIPCLDNDMLKSVSACLNKPFSRIDHQPFVFNDMKLSNVWLLQNQHNYRTCPACSTYNTSIPQKANMVIRDRTACIKPLILLLTHAHSSHLRRDSFFFSDPNMPFKRYVEIGRVALVNYGKEYGRLVVIVDVIDQNRALVDAPDMIRGQINFKRLSLTDIKIDIPRVPKKKTLIQAMEAAGLSDKHAAADVKNKWENSSWGRKLIVQKSRAALNDFDRFKVMVAKIKRGRAIRQELAKLKKENAA
ncbi:hypothetical protein ZIOFF_053541 [Zingiber officinale]|uniref:Large ribosomal subunit protein eL14 domain-containing protein n=1 Tax=Zingiber officinale TaxID=94328 RepID=A0A8J5KIM8_ZINOF|nr:hypothetical protein ZIOFF_053541 [Zingiber officinale]